MLVLIRHRPFFSPFSCFWTPLPVFMDSPLILRIPAVYDASLKLFKTLSHTAWTGEDRMLTLNDSCMLSDYREKTSGNHQKKKNTNTLWIIAMFKLLRKICADYYSLSLPFTSERLFLFASSAKEEKLPTVLKLRVISFRQESSRDSGPAQRHVQPLLLKLSNI